MPTLNPRSMLRLRALPLLSLVGALAVAAPARAAQPAAPFAPDTVVVQKDAPAPGAAAPPPRVVAVPAGSSVAATTARLDAQPGVRAVPDYIAHAAAFFPRDPGAGSGWADLQWNFVSKWGVNAVPAWRNLIRAGRPGGRGVTIAVLDTGVAYRDLEGFRRSPDFARTRFVPGYDFIGKDDLPLDEHGHGTFVTGTIAEDTNNDIGATGLAYGASIMPVRVLNAKGAGQASVVAKGIFWAVDHGAQVINLSLEFPDDLGSGDLPEVVRALRYARAHNVLVVGAAGNQRGSGFASHVAEPARDNSVLSVGASTIDGCLAWYSSSGRGLDLVAPGGGDDARIRRDPHCHPGRRGQPTIYQVTFQRCPVHRHPASLVCGFDKFFLPERYEGTSMAAPHVSAAAALVIASGTLGRRPSVRAVINRLEGTARDLGHRGPDTTYGYGLLDIGRATAP